MLTTLPDIFNHYREHLSTTAPSHNFTYFSNVEPFVQKANTSIVPLYDMWKSPLLTNTDIENIKDILSSQSAELPHCTQTGSECSSYSGSSNPPTYSESSSDADDVDASEYVPPCMVQIYKHKRLQLTPSAFSHGCICGHHVQYRDMVYETRKRRYPKSMGITIRPKTPALTIALRP